MFPHPQDFALNSQPRRRRAARRGFTLIELLVAAVITAVLAGFIVTIVSNVSGFWNRASGRLSTEAQARYILDQLSLDLSSAQFRDDGSNAWMAADVFNNATGVPQNGLWQAAAANPKPTTAGATGSLNMTTPSIADARFGANGVWLRFFTTKRGSNTATDNSTLSAPVAVGYQIIRRFSAASPTSQKTAYLFHRAEVRPSTIPPANRPGVLESGYDITSAPYSSTNNGTNNGATVGDPRSILTPGSRTNFSSVIGENVIDFGVRCYVRDATQPTGLRLIFPASNDAGGLANANSGSPTGALPGVDLSSRHDAMRA
jgi:prepilin-type N-terminal cleavage/methylation domain-containing protein